jgi:coenzyme F420-reducing hydrogenase delta subunit/Pyruvate/2-oxoacid:ferredoxin oxidoreductase delta subunit
LENTPNPRIAFIQCVGSRNRALKKDYCSQVCCKVSLRHTQKLIHKIPDASITLFYMDLQIMGKEIRQALSGLSQQVELVQGVPAEILENPATHALTMVTEDIVNQSRMAREFDLVVLSVGMEPAQNSDETSALLKATPNSWGFFNTKEASADDIYIAGCAAGPKDILGSIQEGKIAGAKVLEDLCLVKKPDTNIAVIGEGPQADIVARGIESKGYPVFAFGTQGKLAGAKILAVDGTTGDFSIYYENLGKKETLTCGAIIAAPEPFTTPNHGKGELRSAIDLNSFANFTPDDTPQNSLILLDYFGPEYKTSARLALTAAMAAKNQGKEVTILMNKMLVHTAIGQQLYDQARKSGIHFLRFNTPDDITIKARAKGFNITLKEASLGNFKLTLEPDCLVLPESIRACPGFEAIAKFLRSSLDREGFLQSPNVRHRLTQSPRKGIFFAGTCHDEVDAQDLGQEIQEVLASLADLNPPAKTTGVKINEKKCAKCLTCYRICPHAAIIINEKMRPQIMEDACFSCHLCVSNCPAYAIESESFTNKQLADKVKEKMVVFACERSSALAANNLTLPDKIQLITLPCACRISSDMILKCLINGASKVIVSGCHEGNCRSMEGSATAGSEVGAVGRMPGIKPGMVTWEPVAANETRKFQRIISKA